ncbi:MAG TPA: hypothetical protein VGR26_14455 [Acidimicrobiales bacterium]|nr:hypothetical protein [Acidimicrobiales bacterium]
MKKALVATCVVAMTAFSVTGATADPVATARANAYGIHVGGSLLDDLIEREPEVTSVFPPGSSVEEDVVTVDGGSLAFEGVGIVQAETRAESTIVPTLRPDDDTGGGGDLLGDLLGGGGGGGGDLLGGLLDGSNEEGEDEEILIPVVNARGFSSISITGVALEDEAGGDAGGGLLGDLLGGGGDGGTVATQQVGDITGGGAEQLLTEVVFEALLRLGVIESEAVAVCAGDQVFFDVASRIVDDQGSDIEIGDVLDDIVRGVIDVLDGGPEDEALLGDLINIEDHEFGPTADGTGFFVNALHITVGGDGGTVQAQQVPDTTIPPTTVPDTGGGGLLGDLLGGGEDGVGGGDEPLLDIILGHSEVSATSCAAPPATSLVPTGDAGPSLPRTGGLGVLPAVLGVGLLGGALTAGRYALRARRNGDSL